MGVYSVCHRMNSRDKEDVLAFSYILKPTESSYDFFSSMDEVEQAIKEDANDCIDQDGEFCIYDIIDLYTNTMKTVHATCRITASIVIE